MRVLVAVFLLAQLCQAQEIKLTPGKTPVSISPTVKKIRVSLAQSKANRMAKNRRMAHLGGGFGKGRSEGVGTSNTRERAIHNCCYWGRRTPIDIGAAQNGRRWYACVIYR